MAIAASHLAVILALISLVNHSDALGKTLVVHRRVEQHRNRNTGPAVPTPLTLAGVSCIYQPPANKSAGLWLLLHACQASARDWFGAYGDVEWNNHGGFHEETLMANELVRRGYGLLAMQSASGLCWANGEETRVAAALKQLPGGVPAKLYAVGASSGGVLLTMLVARRLATFQGIVLNVAPPIGAQDRSALSAFPPTAIVYMPDDPQFATSRGIGAVRDALVSNGCSVAVYAAYPKPVSAEDLCSRLQTLTPAVCARVAQGLQNTHMLEGRGGKLYFRKVGIVPGAASLVDYAMKQVLPQAGILPNQLRQVWQELKVIEGVHSPTAEHFASAADFVTGVGKPEDKVQTQVVQCQHSKTGLPSNWVPQREVCAPPDVAKALAARSPLSSFNSLSSFMCACLYVKVTVCSGKMPHLVDFNGDIVNLTLPSGDNLGRAANATVVTTFLLTAKRAVCSLNGKPEQTGQQDCKTCAKWDRFT